MDNIAPDRPTATQPWHPSEVVEQEPEQGVFFQWWYTLTAPPRVPVDASFVRREVDRKARLLSTVAFFFGIVLLIFLPASFFMQRIIVIADTFAIVATLIALIFNRVGKTTLSGLIIVFGSEIALATGILGNNPFRPADIQLYDLYVLLILLAVSLLPPRYVFLFALLHSLFISVDLIYLMGHPELAGALSQDLQTQIIPAIARSVGLQLLAAGVSYIWVGSSSRAIERANRAEMVATLEHTIAEQRAISEQEKQELTESIQLLIQTHTALANGQTMNRIPYPPAKILWPLIGTMNTLWGRLQRAQQVEREYQQLQQAIATYANLIRKDTHAALPLVNTGTSLDQLILAAQTSRGGRAQQSSSEF
ncbi:MAG: hypothetical protein J2P37_08760 [Ktedonobacteraceae bacterium]|nr:hypothetical protein [Ktedonobacteraceae bacterium]MBO0791462.1 hypothetical protein [Ktedonobacteraceae bacterium]